MFAVILIIVIILLIVIDLCLRASSGHGRPSDTRAVYTGKRTLPDWDPLDPADPYNDCPDCGSSATDGNHCDDCGEDY